MEVERRMWNNADESDKLGAGTRNLIVGNGVCLCLSVQGVAAFLYFSTPTPPTIPFFEQKGRTEYLISIISHLGCLQNASRQSDDAAAQLIAVC